MWKSTNFMWKSTNFMLIWTVQWPKQQNFREYEIFLESFGIFNLIPFLKFYFKIKHILSNIIIFESISCIVVDFFSLWFLICLVWICTVIIQQNIDETYKKVHFLFNIEQIPRNILQKGLGHFEFSWRTI